MSPGQRRCGLGSLLLLLGGSLGVLVEIHRDSVNCTVGHSVLLPISYRFDAAPRFPVSITWRFHGSSDVLVTCMLLNCSLGAGGAPTSCSAKCFSLNAYRGRAHLFPENGSLLLQDLQLNNSRVYAVTFSPPPRTWTVTLTVHEQRPGSERGGGGGGTATHIPCYVLTSCYCCVLLLLQLLFHLRWLRPASWEASETVS